MQNIELNEEEKKIPLNEINEKKNKHKINKK